MEAGDNITTKNAHWSFRGKVATTFATHINRSVPFYKEGHDLICQLSDFFIKPDSVCYDIGTSLGTLLYLLQKHNSQKENVQWIGIDKENDMIKKATEKRIGDNITFQTNDIFYYELEKTDFVVSYYTIQFIMAKHRQLIISKIYKALNWGGGFVFFEKVRASDARFQDLITTLYFDYKAKQGYTEKEILGKLNSLKGILDPFTSQANRDLLIRAGFRDIITIQKYLCFEGLLAIK